MIVFLKKIRVKTIFSAFDPVVVEPLELCYLKSILDKMGIDNYIIDELFNLIEPSQIIPDAVVLTGYNVAENQIKYEAGYYRSKYPNTKIIIGGVHIQGNSLEFHSGEIDYVCKNNSLKSFESLINQINCNVQYSIDGIDYYDSKTKRWNIGKLETVYENENIIPDRDLLNEFSNKLRYMEKGSVALIKGSTGCPYSCSYCYCRLLNNGHYIKTDFQQMINEIKNIHSDYFWIVDDVLFASRNDALEFINIIKKEQLNVNIIGYLRADFILRERDLLPKLKEAGLCEIIVGFEATSNDELKGYDKKTNALDYPMVISLLKENHIDLTALFMVQPDYKFRDFKNLYKFISKNNIDVYTISILTPIKGTKSYEILSGQLTTNDPRKFDFLHLVLNSRLPKWLFYLLFYGVHIRLLKSKRVWKYILKK